MVRILGLFLTLTLHSTAIPHNINDSLFHSVADAICIDSIRMHMQNLQDFGSRYAFNPNQRKVAEYVQNYFNAQHLPSVEIDSFLLFNDFHDTSWQYNIIASIPGTQNPERILILGAHHDAMSGGLKIEVPGADDNASGVAAMLEIARVLQDKKYTPRNTIRFISFAAEEVLRLLMGSKDYAKKAAAAKMDIRLMVNMDMLAWTSDTAHWQMNIEQYPGQEWILPMVKKAVAKVSPIAVLYHGATAATDCYAFYAEGFPAAGIGENYGPAPHPADTHPYYHTVNDRVENYDLRYCTELVKGISAIMLYADDSLPPVGIINKTVSTPENKPFMCRYTPSTETISIDMKDNRPGYPDCITLYSSQGRKLHTVNIPGKSRNTSLHAEPLLSRGILIIAVSYSGRIFREKISVVK